MVLFFWSFLFCFQQLKQQVLLGCIFCSLIVNDFVEMKTSLYFFSEENWTAL